MFLMKHVLVVACKFWFSGFVFGQARKRLLDDVTRLNSNAALVAALVKSRPAGGKQSKKRRTHDRAIELLTLSASMCSGCL